jgi:hypothetical protein
MNRRERRSWYRFFYNSNAEVGTKIDESSFKSLCLGDIKVTGGNPVARNYIYDFFGEMSERLKLLDLVNGICFEWFLMGNCVTFVEDGVFTGKNKESYDKDKDYKGWNKLLILPPDQVRIRKHPLTDEVLLDYMPDPETLKSLKKDKKSSKILKDGNTIPLDQDPFTGSFAYMFSRKRSQYDTMGLSVLEKHMSDLSAGKKITLKIFEAERQLLNSKIKFFIEECLFKPVALKKGFVGPLGVATILYPEVSLG